MPPSHIFKQKGTTKKLVLPVKHSVLSLIKRSKSRGSVCHIRSLIRFWVKLNTRANISSKNSTHIIRFCQPVLLLLPVYY